jgi:hypothetical protein
MKDTEFRQGMLGIFDSYKPAWFQAHWVMTVLYSLRMESLQSNKVQQQKKVGEGPLMYERIAY